MKKQAVYRKSTIFDGARRICGEDTLELELEILIKTFFENSYLIKLVREFYHCPGI